MIIRPLLIAALCAPLTLLVAVNAEPLPAIQTPAKGSGVTQDKPTNLAPIKAAVPATSTSGNAPRPMAGGPISAIPRLLDSAPAVSSDAATPAAIQPAQVSGRRPKAGDGHIAGGVIPGTGSATVRTVASTQSGVRIAPVNGAVAESAVNERSYDGPPSANGVTPPRSRIVEEQVPVPGRTPSLPGIEPKLAKPIVIQTQSGINEVIKVSNKQLNRLVVPFDNPVVVDLTNLDYKVSGNAIYVYPTGVEPIGIFIQDRQRPNSGAISLTLVPQDIPGQTVSFTLETGTNGGAEEKKSNEYIDTVKYIMRSAAKALIPDGFNDNPMIGPKAQLGPITATPKRRLGGVLQDLYIYELQNIATQRVTLSEQSFYKEGVLAVSFFPRIQLDPAQTTKVFILVHKADGEASE